MGESPERPDGAWEPTAEDPAERRYFRGVASVPQRATKRDEDTGDLPSSGASWSRRWQSGQVGAQAPPGGRWRTLRRGRGWTVAGFWFAVVCWGVWAVSRGTDFLGSALAIVVVLAVGALVFAVSRLLGRVVLEGTMGRSRYSAWPSHLATFLLLVVGGVAFLQQTWWLVDAWNWVSGNLA